MTLLPTACRVPHHHLAIDTYYKMSQPTLKLRPYHTPDKGVDSPAEEQDSLYSASDPSISSLHSSTSGAANLDVTGTGEKFFEALDSPTAPATPTSFPRLKTADTLINLNVPVTRATVLLRRSSVLPVNNRGTRNAVTVVVSPQQLSRN